MARAKPEKSALKAILKGRIAALIWVLVLAPLAGWYGYSRLGASPPPPAIEVSPTAFDFGEVRAKVQTTFLVRNTGGEPLRIQGVSTSCGCTRAWVESETLLPGRTTKLYVSFDPDAHDRVVGPVVRQVYLRSNDPARPETTVEIRATVLAKGEAPEAP